jgi:hypothetical protein
MKSSPENVEYVRALWFSLCPVISPPTEDEVREWLNRFPMRYVVHAVKVTLRDNERLVKRNQAGYTEDEAVQRAEEIMRSEQDGFEQRRAA